MSEVNEVEIVEKLGPQESEYTLLKNIGGSLPIPFGT